MRYLIALAFIALAAPASAQSACQLGGRAVDCRHFITTNPDQEAARQRQMQYERQLTDQIRRDLQSQRRK
jgi:hypothetical protein